MVEHFAPDDLSLLAERLRLGLPLRGFDGRDIPIHDPDGSILGATEAAHALLLSAASLLAADFADALRMRRARPGGRDRGESLQGGRLARA